MILTSFRYGILIEVAKVYLKLNLIFFFSFFVLTSFSFPLPHCRSKKNSNSTENQTFETQKSKKNQKPKIKFKIESYLSHFRFVPLLRSHSLFLIVAQKRTPTRQKIKLSLTQNSNKKSKTQNQIKPKRQQQKQLHRKSDRKNPIRKTKKEVGKKIAKMPKDAISHKTLQHTSLSSILFYKTETAFPEL